MMDQISVVIPTFNEKGTIGELIRRIDIALCSENIEYELIFIDDHSTDGTFNEIKKYKNIYPIRLYYKRRKKGKSFSLLEGFKRARYSLIAMIDADLQYPPEAIPEMMKKLGSFDIVVSERVERKVNIMRKVLSYGFAKIFGKFLHSIDTDVQSGLKIFKTEIIERIRLNPTKWTFDLEFLVNAKDAGYKIGGYRVGFDSRKYGKSKVSLLGAIYEIGMSSVKLKLRPKRVIPAKNELVDGFHYRGVKYVTYSFIKESETAFQRMSQRQKEIGLIIFLSVVLAFFINLKISLIFILGAVTLLYLIDIIFYFYLTFKSLVKFPELNISKKDLQALDGEDLPKFTVLCPLYKEGNVVKQFINAIEKLDYPKDKLQVLLLLEDDDMDTISKINNESLPFYFEKIIVPNSRPKTKPKACNYGLLFATGDYTVIYDAEDMPESDQLLKVVSAFNKLPKEIVCVQAKLNFYNPRQNLLTSLFASEYSLWFDLILPGLQSLEAPIPLGGTSNYFKTEELKKMNGWDAFNVTEDCDLGMRLSSYGYQTAIVDSTTFEEANSAPRNWFGQRTRWLKGYMQTYLVHTRTDATKNIKESFFFQLIVGGKIFLLFINPLMWIITLSYFILRPHLGHLINTFYPAPVLYMGVLSLVFGNFLHLYSYMMGCAKRKEYGLIKYAVFVPFYWIMMSGAAWSALYKLIRQPHYWFKTLHGLHINPEPSINLAS